MKLVVRSCMLPFLVGVVFMLLSFLVSGEIIADASKMTGAATSRHLQEDGDGSGIDKGNSDGAVSLEDYHPYDPSPSSKASVRPGPIQHGTPLLPYIPSPKPSPPSHSDHDDDDNEEGSP